VYANPDLPDDAVDRDAYVVCVLEQLHRALGRLNARKRIGLRAGGFSFGGVGAPVR
jgi:hypothetical protein